MKDLNKTFKKARISYNNLINLLAATYHDTNISLKTGLKTLWRSTPSRHQNPPSETPAEVSNQTINFETDLTILATQVKEIKLTNMSSSTMEYISQTATSLENKRNDILQQQKYSMTRRNDVVLLM
jgi:hypothetical protein